MAVLSNTGIRAGASAGGGDAYQIEKSLRFEDADSACLKRTPSSSGDQQKWTLSFWFKRCSAGSAVHFFSTYGSTNADDSYFRIWLNHLGAFHVSFWGYYGFTSSDRFEDLSSWYHAVVAMDSTQSTTTDRCKLWINGKQIDTSGVAYPSPQNSSFGWNNNIQSMIGNMTTQAGATSSNGKSYMAEIHSIDGTALDASSFGETDETTGKWIPKKYTGDTASYGTNGFYLKFNGTDLGEDSSGNDNDWTAVNLNPAGSSFNVPCVSFDGTNDYLEIADSTDFDFGTGDFTIECFARPNTPASAQYYSLVMKADTSASYAGSTWWWALYGQTDGTSLGYMYLYDGTTYKLLQGSALSNEKWHHIAVVRDGDTARLYHNGVQVDSTSVSGWTMNTCSNAVRIGTDGGGNYDMNGAISNARIVNGTCLYPNGTTFTVPSRPLANVTNTKLLCCQSSTQASAAAVAHTVSGSINTGTGWSDLVKGTIDSTYSSSDRSVPFNGTAWGSSLANTIRPGAGAWLEMDFGTQFNSATSVKITGQASLDGDTYNGSNENLQINGAAIGSSAWEDNGGGGAGSTGSSTFSLSSGLQTLKWGYSSGSQSTGYLYLAAIEVDGVELKNPLMPKGSLGEFEAGSTLSDNTSDVDVTVDSPTDFDDGGSGTGNYCTLNPLNIVEGSPTFRQGNLQIVGTVWTSALATMPLPTTGKWYFETIIDSDYSPRRVNNYACAGFGGSDSKWGNNSAHIIDFGAVMEYYPATTATTLHANGTFALDDVAGWAIDMDNWKYSVYKNGTVLVDSRDIPQDKGTQLWPFCANYNLDYGYLKMNFGQLGFQQTPPTDYKALNTYNLPDPVITDPSKYFDASIYTGAGSSVDVSTNFSPDLVWVKSRLSSASHNIIDAVRGDNSYLMSNSTDGEDDSYTNVLELNSDGYTVGSNNSAFSGTNGNIGWAWDAGTANTSVSAGGLNSTFFDSSETWSDGYTTSPSYSGTQTRGFDGNAGSPQGGYFDGGLVWEPPSAITWTDKIEVWDGVDHKYGINGGTMTAISSQNDWNTIATGGGTLNSIEGERVSDAATTHTWGALKIDGKMLIDTGVTPSSNYPSLATTYRANPEAGFSIVTWTGTTSNETVAHGLNAKPDFMICKKISTGGNSWIVWHKDIGDTKYLILNSTAASDTDATLFNSHTNDSSTVFSLGTNNSISDTSQTAIAYLWSEVAGYSKFGSYEGNSVDDGVFIHCGFKPAFVMIKNSSYTTEWVIVDNARDTANVVQHILNPDDTSADDTSTDLLDFVSNGFKLRSATSRANEIGNTMIYAAFAESPFKYANAS